MARHCPSKKDKGNVKVMKVATSNIATEHSAYDKVYINTQEFKSYAAGKTTHPTTIKAHHTLEGTMVINGKKAKVLLDTGRTGGNLISASFATTHSIPCTKMKERTKILITMQGSRSESHNKCPVDLVVGTLPTKENKMLVGNQVKYDALREMPFLKQQEVIIEDASLAIDFPKYGIRINCTPTSGNIRVGVVTTKYVIDQHPEVFLEVILEGLPPLSKINHQIQLIPGKNLGTLPTYSIPPRWGKDMSLWINKRIEKGIIEWKAVHGGASIFAQQKKDTIRMKLLVDFTGRHMITIREDKTIANQRMILNSRG